MSTPLLLCVDLQPVFLAAICDSQRVHWRCSFALEAARGLGVPVVFTEQVPERLGHTATELLSTAGNPEVFAKNTFSALATESIAARLAAHPGKELLICGIETSICVFQTALAARAADFTVTVLSDCIGARRQDDAEVVISQLRHAGCSVLPSESVFYTLLHDTKHPFFRAYTALVKKYG